MTDEATKDIGGTEGAGDPAPAEPRDEGDAQRTSPEERQARGFLGLLTTNRFEAFSDGVFAIVITLLVLELHVPAGGQSLGRALLDEWPRYLGYLVSFAFIGSVWASHYSMSRYIKAVDPPLMRLNLLLLLFVSFLPFTTAVVATHLFESFLPFEHGVVVRDLGSERIAVVLFGVNLTLAALMLFLCFRYASRDDDIADDAVAEEDLQRFAKQRRTAVLLQGGATALGFFLPVTAVVIYLVVSVAFIVEPLITGSRHDHRLRARGH